MRSVFRTSSAVRGRLDRTADVRPYLDQLAQQHPDSLWRLDALIVVANQANTDNEPGTFLPLYQACAAGFPTDPRVCLVPLAAGLYRLLAEQARRV